MAQQKDVAIRLGQTEQKVVHGGSGRIMERGGRIGGGLLFARRAPALGSQQFRGGKAGVPVQPPAERGRAQSPGFAGEVDQYELGGIFGQSAVAVRPPQRGRENHRVVMADQGAEGVFRTRGLEGGQRVGGEFRGGNGNGRG